MVWSLQNFDVIVVKSKFGDFNKTKKIDAYAI